MVVGQTYRVTKQTGLVKGEKQKKTAFSPLGWPSLWLPISQNHPRTARRLRPLAALARSRICSMQGYLSSTKRFWKRPMWSKDSWWWHPLPPQQVPPGVFLDLCGRFSVASQQVQLDDPTGQGAFERSPVRPQHRPRPRMAHSPTWGPKNLRLWAGNNGDVCLNEMGRPGKRHFVGWLFICFKGNTRYFECQGS